MVAIMPQRNQNEAVANRARLAAILLLVVVAPAASVAQDDSRSLASPSAAVAEHRPIEPAAAANDRLARVSTNDVIAAVLCFAVGFAACLFIVHQMLPGLVHAECVETIRDYLAHTARESDIRVVILDRESHDTPRKPRRASMPTAEQAAETSHDSKLRHRVDQPGAAPRAEPDQTRDDHNDDAPESMLAQIYKQNLHLRDQLRRQSRSVKQ